METAAIAACRPDFLCAGQRGHESNCRERSDPRQRFAGAKATIDEMMNQHRFGDAGRRIVIEEFLHGTECSMHALLDGKHYVLLESARDHKRAWDGDQGPNTGGMGAFSPANDWNSKLQSLFDSEIMEPLLRGLLQECVAFRGLLYPGLSITIP